MTLRWVLFLVSRARDHTCNDANDKELTQVFLFYFGLLQRARHHGSADRQYRHADRTLIRRLGHRYSESEADRGTGHMGRTRVSPRLFRLEATG